MNTTVLEELQLSHILNLPRVVQARVNLSLTSKVNFTTELPDDIKTCLKNTLGLDLSSIINVPMQWLKGDSPPHIDSGALSFQKTHLVYLTDSSGEFILDGTSYPIKKGFGFVFSEGLLHETRGTANVPRLLIGPMSEGGLPVGAPTVNYYLSETDALTYTNSQYSTGSFTIETVAGFSSWRIASNSVGSSSQAVIYNVGDTLINDGSYFLYRTYPCFLEGTTVLCVVNGEEKYIPVQDIRKGTLVKTSKDGYKKVHNIGHSTIYNSGNRERIENRLYIAKKGTYPELTDDLIITGAHSILVDTLTDVQKEKTKKSLGKIYVTSKKYRLMAFIDERAEPWNVEGIHTIWSFALENPDIFMNYGIYVNGGLLVETTSIRFLRDKSNMTIVL